MKAVIQRVLNASVEVDNNIVSKIENGFLILLGVEQDDTEKSAQILASKIAKLRVFSDDNDKMNLSLIDTKNEALVVSQFTLCADCKKGNRPSFSYAAQPKIANELYEFFANELKKCGVADVKKGVFGADMKISLVNDGPVTIIFDTKEWEK